MAWNNNPVIRDLEPYAKKHGYKMVIALCIKGDRAFAVNSYGKTKHLCDAAKQINEHIYDKVLDREIIVPDDI